MTTSRRSVALRSAFIGAAVLLAIAASPTKHRVLPREIIARAAAPAPLPSPEAVLMKAIQVFHERRLPPYVTYTLVRKQKTALGYPDYEMSYKVHIWCRTADNACLTRKAYRDDYDGPMQFQTIEFNEAEDPGPPTADLFQRGRSRAEQNHPNPVPTGSAPPLIASVRVRVNTDYKAVKVAYDDGLIHLSIIPFRDVERNRLREVWLDPKTYELKKAVATDRLFIIGTSNVYGVTDTITLEQQDGIPVVTYVDGVTGDGYSGDGKRIQIWFKDIQFPSSLPGWYFDPRTYAQHQNDAPT